MFQNRIKFLFQVPGALLVLPAATGELFWSAAVLSALGSTLAVIIGLPLNATIIVSGKFNGFFIFFKSGSKHGQMDQNIDRLF